jgi:hypothetical protein
MQIKPEASPHVLIFSPALDRWGAFNAHLTSEMTQKNEGYHPTDSSVEEIQTSSGESPSLNCGDILTTKK